MLQKARAMRGKSVAGLQKGEVRPCRIFPIPETVKNISGKIIFSCGIISIFPEMIFLFPCWSIPYSQESAK